MNAHDLGQSFVNREPIDGVLYLHNDPVRIIAGAHKGASGSLVTVISLKPEPRFVVELEAGRDVEVAQSEIERVDA
jgi:hypothetical protein